MRLLDETAILAYAAYVDLNPIGPCVNKQGARCSNKGFLPMSMAEYLSLLDWTARHARAGRRGSTPKRFTPLFDRLGISAKIWCRLVKDFGKLFSVVAGQPSRIDEHRSKGSSRRYRSCKATRELLAPVQVGQSSALDCT